jgi:hypothetical protein
MGLDEFVLEENGESTTSKRAAGSLRGDRNNSGPWSANEHHKNYEATRVDECQPPKAQCHFEL